MSGKMSTTMFINMVAAASRTANYLKNTKINTNSPLARDAISFSLASLGENACAVPKYVSDLFPEVPWPQLRELSSLAFYEARSEYIKKTAKDVVDLIPKFREIIKKLDCPSEMIAQLDARIEEHNKALE